MRALVDCNNFFVSCERVFNPALNGKPVVVLSGNDGCIIARSNEAKALGIPMGAPAYQWQGVLERNDVKCFSGNHVLYYDMSRRIMTVLAEMVDNIAVYSVDEAFFDVPDGEGIDFLRNVAYRIQKCVGVPVSIGASRTRTLAKIASHIAKKECLDTTHAFILNERAEVHRRLRATPIGDVWGIGRRLEKILLGWNVNTAFDFANLSQEWVKKQFTVIGERTWLELHGVDCEDVVAVDAPRQSLMHSRTFSEDISDKAQLCEIIASFTSISAAKLRGEGKAAGRVTVFLATNRFRSDKPQYSNSVAVRLQYPTASTNELVKYAINLLQSIYREGYDYKRAGVQLSDFEDMRNCQLKLFNPIDEIKHRRLMAAVDNINNNLYHGSLHLAADGVSNIWHPKQQHRSREYTTKFSDILTINCNDKK